MSTNNKSTIVSLFKKYKWLKWALGILTSTFFLYLILFIIIVSSVMVFMNESDDSTIDCEVGESTFPQSILDQKQYLEPAMEEYSIPQEYEDILLAQLYQESGANEAVLNSDPWQASESLCGTIGCITDPLQSTEQAMSVHRQNIDSAQALGIEDDKAIMQAYNFGNGFLYWMSENGYSEYSEDIAYDFSVHMTEENPEYGNSCPIDPTNQLACYGDYKYISHIQAKMDETCSEGGNGGLEVGDGKLTTIPMDEYMITQHFGATNGGGLGYDTHAGIDFDWTDGSPIYAAGDGVVKYAGCNEVGPVMGDMCSYDGNAYGSGFGNMVMIDHGDGLVSIYGHMQDSPLVEIGDEVTAGQQLGRLGNTGNSTGSHFHFEVQLNGTPVDPNSYLPIYENAIVDFG